MDLLIATTNQHKLAEFRELFRDLPYQVMSLSEVGITDEVAETGLTFRENAIIKAEGYAALSGRLALADDSGLAVDALGGRPGVFSARYGGPNADPPAQHRLLLQELEGVPWEQRGAQFVCGIAIAQRGRATAYVERQWAGLVALVPKGSFGFGYDPLFWLPDEGSTAGELPAAKKNRISHRAMAAQAAHALLAEWLA